jgi:hypothetical protein
MGEGPGNLRFVVDVVVVVVVIVVVVVPPPPPKKKMTLGHLDKNGQK